MQIRFGRYIKYELNDRTRFVSRFRSVSNQLKMIQYDYRRYPDGVIYKKNKLKKSIKLENIITCIIA